MLRKSIVLIGMLLLNSGTGLWSQETRDTCVVTYVANEGFLVETGDAKVLIDALFGNIKGNWCDQPGDSVRGMMINGTAPFDAIDAVLVTHKHSDHFDGSMVMSFLKNNRKAFLICPEQVDNALKRDAEYSIVADRIKSIPAKSLFDTSLSVNGVNVRALRLNHGSYVVTDSVSGKTYDLHRDVENVGYLVNANGFSVFHSGDDSPSNKGQYKAYAIGGKQIDVAFLDRVFLRRDGQDLINEYIHPHNIVFMHIEPGKGEYYRSIIKNVPEMFVFARPLEKKIYLKTK